MTKTNTSEPQSTAHFKPRSQRPLLSRFSGHPLRRRRQEVLQETIEAFTATEDSYQRYHELAQQNVARWHTEAMSRGEELPSGRVEVYEGDWGDVTHELTRRYGLTFPVLNMPTLMWLAAPI